MSNAGFARLRRGLLVGAGILVATIAVGAYLLGGLRRFELSTVDMRFTVRGDREPSDDVVVVEVDEQTLRELRTPWPFPRSWHGDVITNLTRAGARAIDFDIIFTEPQDPEEDAALRKAIRRAGNVVLGSDETAAEGSTVLGGPAVVRSARAQVGTTLAPPDPGGVIRRTYLDVNGFRGLAIATAERATGRSLAPRTVEGTRWIDFSGGERHLRRLPYSQVLKGRFDAADVRGKIVVVGTSAPALQDLHATSTAQENFMSGPEIQAHAIASALAGYPLREARTGPGALLVLIAALAPALLALWLRPAIAWPAALASAAALTVALQIAFDSGVILPAVYSLGAFAMCGVAAVGITSLTGSLDRRRLREQFERFVPGPVVDDVLAAAGPEARLRGVEVDATVMFCDLRGFTTFAERQAPAEVIEALNRFLDEMTDAIMDHGGTLTSYMGDGLMAVFGAPLRQDDHADRALAAAREMLEVRLVALNAWLAGRGTATPFWAGIGLNSGTVLSGNIGGERRLEYTAIGDTTNTASRIEALTRTVGMPLLIAASTHERLSDPPADLVDVGEHVIRGRSARVRLWGLGERAPAT